jgi:hypothetical protein
MSKLDDLDGKFKDLAEKCTKAIQSDRKDEVAILMKQKAAAKAEWHKEYIREKHASRK